MLGNQNILVLLLFSVSLMNFRNLWQFPGNFLYFSASLASCANSLIPLPLSFFGLPLYLSRMVFSRENINNSQNLNCPKLALNPIWENLKSPVSQTEASTRIVLSSGSSEQSEGDEKRLRAIKGE